jgi:hypothetical protein
VFRPINQLPSGYSSRTELHLTQLHGVKNVDLFVPEHNRCKLSGHLNIVTVIYHLSSLFPSIVQQIVNPRLL